MNNFLINQLHDVAEIYPEIDSIILFGSRAYGDNDERSDIDLAVKAPELSDMDWLLFVEQVEDELDTLLKIDLVLYDHASETLREQIDQCHKILYHVQSA